MPKLASLTAMTVLTAIGLMFCLVDPAAAEAKLALSECCVVRDFTTEKTT
jgi:hypothetical protein